MKTQFKLPLFLIHLARPVLPLSEFLPPADSSILDIFGDSQLVILHTHVTFGHAQTSQSQSSSSRALLCGFTTAPLSGLL